MIAHALSLETLGEVARIDISRAAKVSIRGIEDLAGDGVVEVRRAWGPEANGPSESYSTAKTLDLSGNTTTDIDPEDCTHLAVVVTSEGVGGFDLEWNTQGRRYTRLERLEISLSAQGLKWRGTLQPADRVATMVVSLSDDAGSPAISLRRFIDPESQGYGSESIGTDGSSTSFDLGAIAEIGIFCDQAQSDIIADVWICYSTNIESSGLERMGIAYLEQSQEFTGSNLFSGNFQLGDLASGVHTIGSSASANRAIDIPDVEGDVCIITDLSPSDGEYPVRNGDGFDLTDLLKAGDGSAASPSITFADDDNNGLFRSGSDDWGISVGGAEVIGFGTVSIFKTISISAAFVEISGTYGWGVTAANALFENTSASAGGKITLLEGSTNGTNGVSIQSPASLASSYILELPNAAPSDGQQLQWSSSAGRLVWV